MTWSSVTDGHVPLCEGRRICTTRIGRIAATGARARRSLRPCRRSPTPSVTRRAARVPVRAELLRGPTSRRRHGGDGRREVGVHANVARHHLDKLAAGGYLEVVSGQGRRRRRRSPVEAVRVVARCRRDERVPGAQRRPAAVAARSRARPSATDEAEAMAEEVGPSTGGRWPPGLQGDALASRAPFAAVGDAGRRRRAHRARVRGPRRGSQRSAADHQQPLPVRRRRHRASGDLRRRPRHGAGMLAALVDRRRRSATSSPSELAAATRSAPPPSELRPGVEPLAQRCHSAGSGVLDDSLDDLGRRLGGGAGVERRLRVVLDHQLAGFRSGAVDEHLDQAQRHVDAARHAGGGDDPPIEVLDHALAGRDRAVLGRARRERSSAWSRSAPRAARRPRARATRCTPTS
jgi:hypothetical protein